MIPLAITKAEYLEDYRLLIWFNDNAVKIVDMAGYLYKPLFAPLKVRERFKKFYISHNTIEWTGEIDIAPEFLYNIATQTLREGNRSQWEWGEPYSDEQLQPRFEEAVAV